jgi:hypothetical protein
MVFCPKCGKANPEEATYCNSCGNPLPKTINTNNSPITKNCPVCNKTISSENNFCPYCATDLRVQKIIPQQTNPQPQITSTPYTVPKKSHTARNVTIGLILAIVFIAIIAIALSLGTIPAGTIPGTGTSANAAFTITSQSANWASYGGFLGIDQTHVIVVNATVENTGNAAGGCTVYAQVTDTDGSYWTQSQSIYLEVGASQALGFQFGSVPTTEQYTWSVSTTPPSNP